MSEPEPEAKKTKLDAYEQAVEYYWSYMEDEDDEIDVLIEISDVLLKNVSAKPYEIKANLAEEDLQQVLLSVVYFILADHAISDVLSGQTDDDKQAVLLLKRSLEFCPYNAACISMAANYIRMTKKSSGIAEYYLKAADLCNSLAKIPYEDELADCLIMNQMLGCEQIEYDSADEPQEWSVSAVASTSRFMAAMLLSGVDSAAAKEQLEQFDLSHRLHPNLWNATFSEQSIKGPTRFAGSALPEPLYHRLCEIFKPGSNYWKESDYDNRGYYSFYSILPDKPRTIVDEVILNHLMPKLKDTSGIVGYEWWVHTRPTSANLGHNLHFDTDETSLRNEIIRHPHTSSVLYLTGGKTSGATVILDQTPDSKENARHAWYSQPCDNTYMTFPGNLLHGVLPCRNTQVRNSESGSLLDRLLNDLTTPQEATPHRLTFMVGFWTHKIQGNKLYGPCGPLPEDAEWVEEIKSYPDTIPIAHCQAQDLPVVEPVWESIRGSCSKLQIPHSIDHRYFCKNAPSCFRDALFEKDHC